MTGGLLVLAWFLLVGLRFFRLARGGTAEPGAANDPGRADHRVFHGSGGELTRSLVQAGRTVVRLGQKPRKPWTTSRPP